MTRYSNPYVLLAARSVHHYLEKQTVLSCPQGLPEELDVRAAAFVSIKKNGRLRGCIGTLEPREENLAVEIIENAVKAAFHDPRFDPVTRDEFPELVFSVDVLSPPTQVNDLSELDPKVYGLIIKGKNSQGVLLPDLEGVPTVEEQIRICRLKGRIGDRAPQEMYRFTVQRFN